MIQISEKSLNKLMEMVNKGNEVHMRYTEDETEIEVIPWKPFEYKCPYQRTRGEQDE